MGMTNEDRVALAPLLSMDGVIHTARVLHGALLSVPEADRQKVVDVVLEGLCRYCLRETFGTVCHCENDE